MMAFKALIDDIKSIDPAEIRLDNIGRWPLVVRIFGDVVIFIAVIAACHVLIISDLHKKFDQAVKKEAELRETFRLRSYEAANLQAYRNQMLELEERLQTLINQLPSDTEVPGLLEDMTETGLSSGLSIESIVLQDEKAHDYYIELPISINATGGYHDFSAFVSGVSGLPRIVTLHDFSITNSGQPLLGLSITAKTYRYKDSGDG